MWSAGRSAERDIYRMLEERKGLSQSSKFLPQETRKRTKSTKLSSKKETEPRAEINETENRKTVEGINENKKQ